MSVTHVLKVKKYLNQCKFLHGEKQWKNYGKFLNLILTNMNVNAIILKRSKKGTQKLNKCECAGIGRQARLRGVCGNAYGFKSRHSHHRNKGYRLVSLFSIFK